MNLVDMIRQTRKEYRTSMNKIAAIKLVRTLTGRGLKEAKDFFDWMDANGDGVSAPIRYLLDRNECLFLSGGREREVKGYRRESSAIQCA